MNWDLISAREAFSRGEIQAWIEQYLQVEAWQNPGLLRRVRLYSTCWSAPQELPIANFFRIAGPGAAYLFPQDPVSWDLAIAPIIGANPAPEDFPPVIAWRELDGVLNLADGNHRLDALSALGHKTCWVLLHEGPLRSEAEIEERAGERDPFA